METGQALRDEAGLALSEGAGLALLEVAVLALLSMDYTDRNTGDRGCWSETN